MCTGVGIRVRPLSGKLLLDRDNHDYYIKLLLHYWEAVGSNGMQMKCTLQSVLQRQTWSEKLLLNFLSTLNVLPNSLYTVCRRLPLVL
jgi:hypothetical protein